MSKSKNEISVKIKSRKCHDCEKETSDYRCESCLAKWRIKHNIVHGALEFTPSTNQYSKHHD